MKQWLKEYWLLLLVLIVIGLLAYFVFRDEKTDYSLEEYKIEQAQIQKDSLLKVIDSLSRELEATKVEVNAEKDSIYSLLVEANNKLIYVYQKQRNTVKVDTFGSAALLDYFSKLPE